MKSYEAPALTPLGSVAELTAGQTGGSPDKGGSLPIQDSVN